MQKSEIDFQMWLDATKAKPVVKDGKSYLNAPGDGYITEVVRAAIGTMAVVPKTYLREIRTTMLVEYAGDVEPETNYNFAYISNTPAAVIVYWSVWGWEIPKVVLIIWE